MKKAKYEVLKDIKGEWRWRLVASNGAIVASGEGYKRKSGCVKGIWAMLKAACSADLPSDTFR